MDWKILSLPPLFPALQVLFPQDPAQLPLTCTNTKSWWILPVPIILRYENLSISIVASTLYCLIYFCISAWLSIGKTVGIQLTLKE